MWSKQLKIFLGIFLFSTALAATLNFWEGDVQKNIAEMGLGVYNPYKEFNEWINDLFFLYLGLNPVLDLVKSNTFMSEEMTYYTICYLRDLVAGSMVYWAAGGIWHLAIYTWLGDYLFTERGRKMPNAETIIHQMKLAQASLFIYALLPVISEYLIESGVTKTYFYVDQIGGWTNYALFFTCYIVCVEIGIYWMHRTLHTNKFLYKYVHGPHHMYNKHDTLSPWASLAFHPLDGVLQACPYTICLFFVPVHYFTHIILLFFTGVWATNIHDSTFADTEPIMGSKYHTVHHTHYMYNFGQFFIFCDWYWGTLRAPARNTFEKVAGEEIEKDRLKAKMN